MDLDTVRANHLLARLPEPALERLLRSAHAVEYRHRDRFISSGEPIHTFASP